MRRSIVLVLGLFLLLLASGASGGNNSKTTTTTNSTITNDTVTQLYANLHVIEALDESIQMDLKDLQIISSEYKELRDQLDNAKTTLSGDSNSNSKQKKVKVLESACTEMARKLQNQCNNIKLLMGKVPSAESAVKTFQEKAKNQGVLTMQQEKTIESLLNRIHSRVAEAKNAVATAEQTLMRPTTNKIKIIYPMTGQTNNNQPPPAAAGGEFPAD
jgi:hypothetical protein